MAKKGKDGKYYNEKQAKWAKKYLAKFDKIEIRVLKGDKQKYYEQMTKMGYKTWKQFILDAINLLIDSYNKK